MPWLCLLGGPREWFDCIVIEAPRKRTRRIGGKVQTILYDDEYDGPRWRYGASLRPATGFNIPRDWIVGSQGPEAGLAHGTVDYPRPLTEQELERFDLVLIATYTPASVRT